jgi:hypothetical protein
MQGVWHADECGYSRKYYDYEIEKGLDDILICDGLSSQVLIGFVTNYTYVNFRRQNMRTFTVDFCGFNCECCDLDSVPRLSLEIIQEAWREVYGFMLDLLQRNDTEVSYAIGHFMNYIRLPSIVNMDLVFRNIRTYTNPNTLYYFRICAAAA